MIGSLINRMIPQAAPVQGVKASQTFAHPNSRNGRVEFIDELCEKYNKTLWLMKTPRGKKVRSFRAGQEPADVYPLSSHAAQGYCSFDSLIADIMS